VSLPKEQQVSNSRHVPRHPERQALWRPWSSDRFEKLFVLRGGVGWWARAQSPQEQLRIV